MKIAAGSAGRFGRTGPRGRKRRRTDRLFSEGQAENQRRARGRHLVCGEFFLEKKAPLAKARAEGPPRNRLVSLLAEDPEIDLFGNEPVRRDGEWVGYVRAAAYGHTLGAAVGLAQVACRDGVTAEWLADGEFAVRTGAGADVAARLQFAPFYDPKRLRILAD